MRSSFMGLEVSKRSIQIAQKALDITNHNLSNIGTKGYTRQRLDQASLNLTSYRNWQTKESRLSLTGQGTYALGVSQIRDDYIDKRYRDSVATMKEYEVKDNILGELDTILDQIESHGLKEAFERFQTDLRDYATNSADKPELANVIRNDAEQICLVFQRYHADLTSFLKNNIEDVKTEVENVNDIIQQISTLNKVILDEYKSSEFGNIVNGRSVSQYGPLELMDQRNLLIDELAQHGNVRVTKNGDGTLNVDFGGINVIDGVKPPETLILEKYENFNAAVITTSSGAALSLTGGELKARIDTVSGNGPYASYFQNSSYGIPYYISAINAYAEAFANLMNETNGVTRVDPQDPAYKTDYSVDPPAYGYDITELRAMFGSLDDVYDSNGNLVERGTITAANIRISKEWKDNVIMPGLVQGSDGNWAFSANLDGLSINKLQMALENPIKIGRANDFKGSIFEYQAFLTNRVSQERDFNRQLLVNSQITVEELLDNRDAVSAVSETEEGINMMIYQKWFNASSRMMTTLDEALDKLINGTGRVGL